MILRGIWGENLISRLQQGEEQRILVRAIAAQQHIANKQPFRMPKMTHENHE